MLGRYSYRIRVMQPRSLGKHPVELGITVNKYSNPVLTVNEKIQPHIVEASVETGRQWINNLPAPRGSNSYRLTLDWTGRYKGDARFDEKWLLPAVDDFCKASSNCIDDVYPRRYDVLRFQLAHLSISLFFVNTANAPESKILRLSDRL